MLSSKGRIRNKSSVLSLTIQKLRPQLDLAAPPFLRSLLLNLHPSRRLYSPLNLPLALSLLALGARRWLIIIKYQALGMKAYRPEICDEGGTGIFIVIIATGFVSICVTDAFEVRRRKRS